MKDFESICRDMRSHNIPVPVNRLEVKIKNAKPLFEDLLKYFLSIEGIDYKWINEYDEIVSWLENNKSRGLCLYGDCGRGKSVIARYVIPAILIKHYGKVVSVYDVTSMNKNIDEVLSKKFITLDDIGTEDIANDFGNKRLAFAEIIDSVEKYGKLIFITTNLNSEQLRQRYGERVVERIISTTMRIKFSGKSLRNF